jgi:two-component system response regulator AtoC
MPEELTKELVMVADDDPAVRDLLSDYLRQRGLTVATAQDGRAAIAAIGRSRYGLVLTDINMPGADGFEVLRAARAANASTYVVIMTGYASLESAVRAVRLGAHDYLTKPISLGQIEVMLTAINDRSKLERENRELAIKRASMSASQSLEARLEAIERRLARLEVAVTRDRRD